jgi:hypothetical protein
MKLSITKVSVIMFAAVSALTTIVSVSAMAKTAPIHDQKFCEVDCNKKYKACNGVEQCQDYVVMSCMRDCLRSDK